VKFEVLILKTKLNIALSDVKPCSLGKLPDVLKESYCSHFHAGAERSRFLRNVGEFLPD
jgi:hypothetical protein